MIAIRGAIRVERNDRAAIFHDTQKLLQEIVRRNQLEQRSIVSAFFTMTPDLNADFPAYAARELGWTAVPMLGAQETAVPGALDRVVRVLLHAEVAGPARHVYLGDAAAMRPDLADTEVGGGAADARPSVPRFGTLLVIGLGLIGGSLALAVRRARLFARVVGCDIDERARDLARRAGAVDASEAAVSECLRRADVVLLAVPVLEAIAWIEQYGRTMPRGSVLIDVGSTKMPFVGATDALGKGVEAVGAHPMAGSELSGMGAARPDLFVGATWALVRTGSTGVRAEMLVGALVEAVGGTAFWMDAERHDTATAATSHLPYLLASALALHLASLEDREAVRKLAGPGLRDMTRLAQSRPAVMAEILGANWENVRCEAERFQAVLAELIGTIRGREATEIARELTRVQTARATLLPVRP